MRRVRFAPSPTGRFHVGNLRTAWVSREWAKALGAEWIVRFEDIDAPRIVPGSEGKQLEDLRSLGLVPDGVYRQSERRERHLELFRRAVAERVLYPCFCSRKEVADALRELASASHGELPVYDGRCRKGGEAVPRHPTVAWRFRAQDESGRNDFIAARTASDGDPGASFVPAYHWACAIDDLDGGYSLIVRAWDLRPALEPQRFVQRWVEALEGRRRPLPAAFHASLVTAADGSRLEKRTRGVTLEELGNSGIGSERLLACFRKSFEAEAGAFAPERVWGEGRQALSLVDLGLS